MKPIPKKLLIHRATLHRAQEKDRWGSSELDLGTTLSYVRLEPSSRIVRDKNNAEIQLAAVLFYDCVNSRPRGLVPRVDDIVDVNGQLYRIQTVEPLYDGKKLHHYEVGVTAYAKSQHQSNDR